MILISWETLPKESQFPYKLRIRSWNSLLHRYLLNIQNFLCKSLTIFHFSLRFAEIGNSQKLLNIFAKCSILDVWQGSEYPSETYDHSTSWIVSVFGVFLVLIFQYLYWIQRDTKYLLESYPFNYFEANQEFHYCRYPNIRQLIRFLDVSLNKIRDNLKITIAEFTLRLLSSSVN